MKKVKRIINSMTFRRCSIILCNALFFLSALYFFPGQQESPFRRPGIDTIEKNLFEYINRERKQRNLPLLKLSAELSAVARKHSRDMAAQPKLTHLSSSGKTYAERLAQDGYYFMDVGENVAFSETFQADFIHQSLMESSGHRENILTPNFDRVGIGVFYSENSGYYITQDFLESFVTQKASDIRKHIQERIDNLRSSHTLTPLVYRSAADEFALEYSKRKAEKKPPPPIPSMFGETHLIYTATPSLSELESVTEDVINAFYGAGGLGVTLARNSDYPGGTYFITLLLFPDLKPKNMEISQLRRIVLQSINQVREKKGFKDVSLDDWLSEEATRISLFAMSQGEKTMTVPSRLSRKRIMTYATEGPYVLPAGLKKAVEKKGLRKIGVGILFGETPAYPQGAFWITVVFD